MPDLAKAKIIEDKIDKALEAMDLYDRALMYSQLNRQGMTLDYAAWVLKKGPE